MIRVLLLSSFVSALVALSCVPAIFYLESMGRPQNPFHMIQLLACLLSGAWFGFFVYVMVMMAVLGA